jgi:hypothetical protein
VDGQGQIIASTVPESNEQDPSQVPTLLDHVDGEAVRLIGDGIYDQAPVYTAVADHSPDVKVIIPRCKDAVLSPEEGSYPSQRDQHLLKIEKNSRFQWQRTLGYDDQSWAKNVFARFKKTFGGRLRAKRDGAQEREAFLACQLLNRMLGLGRPQSYPVS